MNLFVTKRNNKAIIFITKFKKYESNFEIIKKFKEII